MTRNHAHAVVTSCSYQISMKTASSFYDMCVCCDEKQSNVMKFLQQSRNIQYL